MQGKTYVQFQLALAVFGALFAGVMWFAFLRQVPEKTVRGRIVEKQPFEARTIVNHHTGEGSLYWNPRINTIPEGILFGVEVTGSPKRFLYGLNSSAAKEFEMGQEVDLTYQERGVPPFWTILAVKTMIPAVPPPAARAPGS